jgi:hypothetical protein
MSELSDFNYTQVGVVCQAYQRFFNNYERNKRLLL